MMRNAVVSAKRTLLKALAATGGFVPFRLANSGRGLVLMYHRFGDDRAGAATSSRAFATHLEYLSSRYAVVPLPKLAGHLASGRRLTRPMAAITIDDGHADAYEVAFPLLKRVGAPATLFAVTGFLDGQCWLWTDQVRYLFGETRRPRATTTLEGAPLTLELEAPAARLETMRRVAARLKRMPEEHRARAVDDLAAALDVEVPARPPDEYAPISWAQVPELGRHGIAVEAHTVTHPILTNVSSETLRFELTHAKARLEDELGRTISVFCYPNGSANAEVRDVVGRAGYTCAVLSSGGLNRPGVDPLGVRRVGAKGDLARFAKTTSGFDSWQASLSRHAGTQS